MNGTLLETIKIKRPALSREFFGYTKKIWVGDDSVWVLIPTPTAKKLNQEILKGHSANKSLIKALTRSGIKLTFKPTTPLFQSDPKNPKLVIRILNKKKSRGTFINNTFVEIL